jgi:hypothetical protein
MLKPKTTLSLELESPAEQLTQDQDAADAVQATNEPAASPFAQIENSTEDTRKPLKPHLRPLRSPKRKAPGHREVVVAKGDTLSTLFEKVGLPAAAVHDVLASDKQAKQFSQLKHGQKLSSNWTRRPTDQPAQQGQRPRNHHPDQERQGLCVQPRHRKPVVRTAYAHGVINSSLSPPLPAPACPTA